MATRHSSFGSQELTDLEAWYQDVQSRLQLIPDPSYKLKYTPTCTAIQQLQGVIQEVLDRQSAVQASLTLGKPTSLDLQTLLDSLVKKQEHLFEGMTYYLQLDMEWLVDVLGEANSRLGELGPFLTRGYLEQQIQLHRLKETQERLSSCKAKLHSIVDDYHLLRISPLIPEQPPPPPQGLSPLQSLASTPAVYAQVTDLYNHLEALLSQHRQLTQRFEERIEHLETQLDSHQQRFLADLSDVEVWLSHVYSLLCQEPARERVDGYGGQQLELEEGEEEGVEEGDREEGGGEEADGEVKEERGGEGTKEKKEGEEEKEEQEAPVRGDQEKDKEEDKEEEEEEEATLQWAKNLQVLPMEHKIVIEEPDFDQLDYHPTAPDIDAILENLENILGKLTIQSQKVKRSIANISFVRNTVSMETAAELKERLAWIKEHWEPLAGRLKHRIAQMKFEKAQKEMVESIQEVVWEIESQPRENLLPEEVEEKFSHLMDFIVDLETFESQKTELISQLESSLLPLTQFPQEDFDQLRKAAEDLRQGYEIVAEKVKQQKTLFECWQDQWSNFSHQLSHFEDWVGQTEGLMTKGMYNDSPAELEGHIAAVEHLKQQLSVEEVNVQYLIDLGNTILACVQPEGEAEMYIDTCLSEVEQLWYNMDTQLQLLQKVQEAERVIAMVMNFVGDQKELEATLADVQLKLSEDYLETLRLEARDLGSVSEEAEASVEEKETFTLSSYEKVVKVNHMFTRRIEEISDSTNSAKLRLQLFIQWWVEYSSNYDKMCPWLKRAESRLEQLVVREESMQCPTISPVELLQNAKELKGEMAEMATVLSALTSNGQSILIEMESKGAPPSEVSDQLLRIKEKWDTLASRLKVELDKLEIEAEKTIFFETAAKLVAWLAERLQLQAICATPPAKLDVLRGYVETLELTQGELANKQLPIRQSLDQTVESLKPQLSVTDSERVEQQLVEVHHQWQKLEDTLDNRKKVLSALVAEIENYWLSVAELETWLRTGEATIEECRPFGADLPRLVEQSALLETVDDDVRKHKKDPEELHSKAMSIISACCKGSGDEILSRCNELESRFDTFSQMSLEYQEQCDDTKSAMQAFQTKFDSFSHWLEGVEGKLAEKKRSKFPISTVQSQLDEHYDFMHECEQQTDQYSDLYCHGNRLSAKYKPSDTLDAMMSSLHNRWVEHVVQFGERSKELLKIQEQWEEYEKGVNGLLSWIMEEAEMFSCEVTTRGDKGIEDHITSCKVFADTLEKKQASIGGIQDLVEILSAKDGIKKNGASDVESRWQDVNQHWNSLCKLLAETLLHLEATYAEVRHVLLVIEQEFDWLKKCEQTAAMHQSTQGNLQIVQEDIDTHYQLLYEIEEHQKEAEYIQQTVDFLVEHSRKEKREELAESTKDFAQRYHSLLTSVQTYVSNMQDSILRSEEELPDSQVTVQQTHAETTAVEITDYLRGVDVIGETSILVTNQAQSFKWVGYGLKIHVPKGTLPAGLEECRLFIKVGLSGQFALPQNTSLSSAVYLLDSQPQCKFSQPISLEIQHSVKNTYMSHLSFVHAKCSETHLPYAFETLEGGVFSSESAYGFVQRDHFSLLGITCNTVHNSPLSGAQLYHASLFYLRKTANKREIHFVITKDQEVHTTFVRQRYIAEGATIGPSLQVEFESNCISLELPSEEAVLNGGWKIIPLIRPEITKEVVENYSFETGRQIPSSQLTALWTAQNSPSQLIHTVTLKGTKEPTCFSIVLDSGSTPMECIKAPASTPDMNDLTEALHYTVADKWEHIGIYLHLPMAALKTITAEHQHDPHKCLIGMLGVWLKRVDPPPIWTAIIEAVEFLGEEQLARRLREKYCPQIH